MRETRCDAFSGEEKTCECGCGKTFVPARRWQKYVNKHHKDAANRNKPGLKAIEEAVSRAIAPLVEQVRELRETMQRNG